MAVETRQSKTLQQQQRPAATPKSAKSSQSSKMCGVDHNARKQLALDIQFAGGIQEFDRGEGQMLANILDDPDREDKCSERGHSIRRKIPNLVHSQWKVWDDDSTHLKKVIMPHNIPLNVKVTKVESPMAKKKRAKSVKSKKPPNAITEEERSIGDGSVLSESSASHDSKQSFQKLKTLPATISIRTSTTQASTGFSVISSPMIATMAAEAGVFCICSRCLTILFLLCVLRGDHC